MRQLQVVQRTSFRESVLPPPDEPADFASPALRVDFGAQCQVVCSCLTENADVYENNARYKKSSPGVPGFRVAVCSYNEAVPPLQVIEPLGRLAYPASLKIAVVCSGVVLFNEFVSMHGIGK